MGYITHEAILVTGHEGVHMTTAHAKAMELFPGLTTELKGSVCNGYASFSVMPDGSKLGWSTHIEFLDKRIQFLNWLFNFKATQAGWIDWVRVWYGGDDKGVKIVDAG